MKYRKSWNIWLKSAKEGDIKGQRIGTEISRGERRSKTEEERPRSWELLKNLCQLLPPSFLFFWNYVCTYQASGATTDLYFSVAVRTSLGVVDDSRVSPKKYDDSQRWSGGGGGPRGDFLCMAIFVWYNFNITVAVLNLSLGVLDFLSGGTKTFYLHQSTKRVKVSRSAADIFSQKWWRVCCIFGYSAIITTRPHTPPSKHGLPSHFLWSRCLSTPCRTLFLITE